MRHAFSFALIVTLGLAGCNKGPSIKTYPVTGTVTYNGNPLAGATVVYIPSNPDAPGSSATTDADGKFSLATYNGPRELLRGAPPGDYKVTVTKLAVDVDPETASAMKNYGNLSQAEQMELSKKMMGGNKMPANPTEKIQMGAKKPTSEIPEKYGKPETSGLTAQVVVGENEPKEFKLSDN